MEKKLPSSILALPQVLAQSFFSPFPHWPAGGLAALPFSSFLPSLFLPCPTCFAPAHSVACPACQHLPTPACSTRLPFSHARAPQLHSAAQLGTPARSAFPARTSRPLSPFTHCAFGPTYQRPSLPFPYSSPGSFLSSPATDGAARHGIPPPSPHMAGGQSCPNLLAPFPSSTHRPAYKALRHPFSLSHPLLTALPRPCLGARCRCHPKIRRDLPPP